MKTHLITLTLALLPLFANAQFVDDGWFEVGNSSFNATLESIWYVDENTGFAVGSGGAFIKTTDGGYSWTAYNIGHDYHFKRIIFTCTDRGFLFGEIRQGNNRFVIILKSVDGGDTWEEVVPPGEIDYMRDVHFPPDFNENHTAYITTAGPENFYKTTDGGDTWHLVTLDQSFFQIQFFNALEGLGVYTLPGIRQLAITADGGETWTDLSVDGLGVCYAIQVLNESVAFISSTNRTAYTTNAGQTWSTPANAIHLEWSSLTLHFSSEQIGYRFDISGRIFQTTDSGETWTERYNDPERPALGMFTRPSNRVDFVSSGGAVFSSDGTDPFVMRVSGIVNGRLNDVWFFDENNGIAVGEYGTVLKTHNAGTTWTAHHSGTTNHLRSVHFTSGDVGFAAGGPNAVIKTTDGGTSWAPSQTGISDAHITTIVFTSENTGYTLGQRVHKTENGGETWSLIDDSYLGWDIHFADENTAYFVGSQGMVRKTINAGVDWTDVPVGGTGLLRAVYFQTPEKGFVAGSWARIFQTVDGGENWTSSFDGITTYDIYDLCFVDENVGYAVGFQGLILKTSNGGETWEQVNSNTIRALLSINLTPDGIPFIVGQDGIVLRKMPSHTLTFSVEDMDNNPVPDAVITFNGVPFPAGHYTFPGLIADTYTYSVAKPGYYTESGTVTIEDQDIHINITLRPTYNATFYVASDYYNTPVGGATIVVDGVGSLNTNESGEATFEDLPAGESYAFEITADHFHPVEGSFEIAQEDATIEVSLHADIDAPVATEATEIGMYGFHANWEEVTAADAYLLYVSADDFVSHLIDGMEVDGITYPVTGTTPATEYKYRIKAINQYGISDFSNVIAVTTGDDTTSNDGAVASNIILYPNPAKDMITIAGMENNSTVEVYSVAGAKIMRFDNVSGGSLEMDVSTLVNGLYIINITTENVVVRKKASVSK